MKPKSDYTREELIDLCKRSIVPHEKWGNRDSSTAQRQVGELLVLLLADCDFSVNTGKYGSIKETIWVEVEFKGFSYFEDRESGLESADFYIPTQDRLDRNLGDDWY